MAIINTILDVIFPSNCISCGKRNTLLCEKCFLAFPQAERENDKWIFPLYDYRHPPVKKAIWFLKYKGKKHLAKTFAQVIHERILEELNDLLVFENFKDPILIPIPLSKKRLRERGYNQSGLLCKELIKIDKNQNFKLENNILIKIKDIEHQARIEDRKKRLENIIGSFAVKNLELIKNKNIILIDDVTTTGATLKEAKKILKQSGAKKVVAFTIAH